MITIHELSRDAYTEIIKIMPNAFKDVEQDYGTVTLTLKPSAELITLTPVKQILIRVGTKAIRLNYTDFHYITLS